MKGRRPRVAVIGTGGSISTPGRDSLDLFEYADYERPVEVDDLLAMFPVIREVADVVPVRFRAIGSTAITPGDWLELARTIHEVVETDPTFDGIVVTHGTATAEETAYFLHLVIKLEIPVVVVGAQRPPNGLSSDAGLNLVDAVRVAGSKAARGRGVLVVLNNEIHCAREVTKTSTSRLHTFQAPEFGVLGHADPDGTVIFYRHSTRRHTTATEFEIGSIRELCRVDIVYAYAGVDGCFIRAAQAAGARGVIMAAFAPGMLSPSQRDAALAASRDGLLIILSNRGGIGRVIPRVADVKAGLIAGDNLNPQKCRVLAMLALALTDDRDEIRRIFSEY